jgi:hypothetical protein
MSGYLANLARRAAGMVPVAHPRMGPGGGQDARLIRGVAEPAPAPLDRIGPSVRDGGRGNEGSRDGLAPRLLAADDVTNQSRERVPRELEEPRKLRLVEPPSSSERRDDAPSPSLPAARPAVGNATSNVDIRPARVAREPDAPRDLESGHRPTPEASAGSDPSTGTMRPRATVIEPALSPAHLGAARTVIESRGRGREVDVRIGMIEIHAEPASPVPAPPAPLATAAGVGRPQGGFDDFVRLRTYAPWER